jgi:hypothetical protein
MDELWDDLKEPVRDAGWANQLNTFPELSVAFWRWAIWKIFESEGAPGCGVVAFISNRTFLAGKPYAGLRKMLRERFDRIEIIDLRGDTRRKRAGVINDQGYSILRSEPPSRWRLPMAARPQESLPASSISTAGRKTYSGVRPSSPG